MEDAEIVSLYWQREERAVAETEKKYGGFCRAVALNLLSVREDAEECVNDTYLRAWNAMPSEKPRDLRTWLGRVVRNLAIDGWRRNRAQKRYDGVELLLSELEDCVPSPKTTEAVIEARELGRVITAWLNTLPEDDRTLFVRRYWNGEALKALAAERRTDPAKLAQRMLKLRRSLKAYLEKEGITL